MAFRFFEALVVIFVQEEVYHCRTGITGIDQGVTIFVPRILYPLFFSLPGDIYHPAKQNAKQLES
ncbi:hypothetical protein QG37_02842 [Candidozyma auris]|nr:hypothetical protein QG37_02842 [[Candida] auris]